MELTRITLRLKEYWCDVITPANRLPARFAHEKRDMPPTQDLMPTDANNCYLTENTNQSYHEPSTELSHELRFTLITKVRFSDSTITLAS